MTRDPRIPYWVECHRDGTLVGDELTACLDVMRRDPEGAAEFRTQVRLSVQLDAELHPSVADQLAQRASSIWHRQALTFWLPRAVAAGILALCMVWYWPRPAACAELDGQPVAAGQIVEGSQPRVIRWKDGSQAVLAGGGVAVVEGDQQLRRLSLRAGSVAVAISAQGSAHNFVIHTPHGEVNTAAAEFQVRIVDTRSEVRVESGEVEAAAHGHTPCVIPAGAEARLAADEPWVDQRPFGKIALWNGLASPGNPRSYAFVPPDVDVIKHPEEFAQQLLELGRRQVDVLTRAGCQGAIIWDLEGWHGEQLTYVGDPRSLPLLAPEMDAVADRYCALFSAAGLRIGLQLRPERFMVKDGVGHLEVTGDPERELADKIAFAQRRWGCSVFFIPNSAPDGFPIERRLPAGSFPALSRRFPATLLLGEHVSDAELPSAARLLLWPEQQAAPAGAAGSSVVLLQGNHPLSALDKLRDLHIPLIETALLDEWFH